jgi:hypothetical protein
MCRICQLADTSDDLFAFLLCERIFHFDINIRDIYRCWVENVKERTRHRFFNSLLICNLYQYIQRMLCRSEKKKKRK